MAIHAAVAARDLKIDAEATAIINRRRRDEMTQERDQILRDLFAREAIEDAKLLERDARGEAGIATYIAALTAKVTIEFYDRRFTINLAHRDNAMRDIAISAAGRLMLYITRAIPSAVQVAENTAKNGIAVPTTPADPQWVEKLLDSSQWLGPAYSRGLITVTDLKGKPFKATKTATATAQPREVRDPWLGR